MPNVIDTDQATILLAVISRLQTNLQLDDSHCFLTLDPMAPVGEPKAGNTAGGDYWLTVSAGDSVFPDGFQEGGGINQVFEDATVVVMGYTRIRLDRTNHDTKLLTDLMRGLMPIKARILAAMLKDDEPLVDEKGNPLLRECPIRAVAPTKPWHDDKKSVGGIGVIFATPFDWNLQNLLP